MKKILYTLLAAFALVSCMEEIDKVDTRPEGNVVLTVFNSTMTKAITDPNGLEYERKLESLECFFYVKDQTNSPCVYYQRLDPVPDNALDDGRADIPLNVSDDVLNAMFPGTNTECNVFLIANLPANTAYAAKAIGTEVSSLNKTLLTMTADGAYDGIDKPFAMAGLGVAKKAEVDRKVSVKGEIPLYRAAAKITISVNIPSSITTYVTKFDGEGNILRDENGEPIKEAQIMQPVFTENQNGSTVVPLQSSFHNGVNKTYLRADYVDGSNNSLINEEDYFDTSKQRYKDSGSSNDVHTYTCEVPFYSYARAWERGADNAAYISFEMPWRNATTDVHKTYYYQIPINIKAQENNPANCFVPNHWYDITANIGVLGSTVESQPHLIGDMTFYVLDWTTEPETEHGDRYEDVVMEKYTYLVVPEKRIEIYNSDTDVIKYEASHKIGLKMNTSSKAVEIIGGTTTNSSYYINCGGNTPQVNNVPNGITAADNFTIEVDAQTKMQTGDITYEYHIPQADNDPVKVYSPVFVYATIWLDFDGDGTIDTNYAAGYDGAREDDFVEHITIVQYPAIYVIPDLTTRYSIYVNDIIKTGDGSGDLVRYPQTGNSYYGLGLVPGTNSTTGANPTYMYVVNVSSLKSNDGFYYNTDNNNNGPQTWYNYVIGDPRQRISDTDLNDDGYDMDQHWVVAPDVNGNQRKLQNYYPTSTEEGAFQVIAPKFRIVSFHGNGHRYHNYEGAKMRCASYQEDGYPAGRWRLPTYAEIQFVIKLQEESVISPIFFGSSKYFTATNQITYNANGSTYMNFQDASPGTINGSNGSVRCVYDEWYWGSEREAQPNPVANPPAGEEYLFTWGDEKVW